MNRLRDYEKHGNINVQYVHGKDRDVNFYDFATNKSQYNNIREPPADYGDGVKHEGDDQSLDSEGKQKSFKRLCERFAEKTSMQGLPYINAAKLTYAKVLWVIILLGGIAGMTLHLYFLIDQFTDYEVQVSVTLGFNNLVFPAVTICNLNAVRESQIGLASQQLQTLISQTDPKKLPPPKPPSGPGPGRKKRFVEDFDLNFENLTEDFDFSHKKGEKDESQQIQNTFQNIYMDLSRPLRRQMGHQLRDMLVQCSFAGFKCFAANFTLVQTEEYGNCYTIQSPELVVSKPGPDFGLTLILYLETDEYLVGITEGYGARVLIHDADTYPFPAAEGMFVSSSLETQIGLREVDITRMSGLYGTCEDVALYKEKTGAAYTRTLCQFLCENQPVIEKCGCYNHVVGDVYKALNTTDDLSPCVTAEQRRCRAEVMAELEFVQPDCPKCVNPCREVQYTKSLSSHYWPTDEYAKVLMNGICERIPDKCSRIQEFNNKGDIEGLAKNFVKLNVFYEDLNYEVIQEKPEIESQQFASDVGGAVGLWIGLSLISIFEIFQLMVECCAFGVHKYRHTQKKLSKEKYRKNHQTVNMTKNKKPGNFNPYEDWNGKI